MENLIFVLALLACPVGMGVMMWMMARGQRSRESEAKTTSITPASLEQLREEQVRLADEIERRASAEGRESTGLETRI